MPPCGAPKHRAVHESLRHMSPAKEPILRVAGSANSHGPAACSAKPAICAAYTGVPIGGVTA
jgi:hypothetical protein